jgi:hypothetical protein
VIRGPVPKARVCHRECFVEREVARAQEDREHRSGRQTAHIVRRHPVSDDRGLRKPSGKVTVAWDDELGYGRLTRDLPAELGRGAEVRGVPAELCGELQCRSGRGQGVPTVRQPTDAAAVDSRPQPRP